MSYDETSDLAYLILFVGCIIGLLILIVGLVGFFNLVQGLYFWDWFILFILTFLASEVFFLLVFKKKPTGNVFWKTFGNKILSWMSGSLIIAEFTSFYYYIILNIIRDWLTVLEVLTTIGKIIGIGVMIASLIAFYVWFNTLRYKNIKEPKGKLKKVYKR